ncbi:aspartyl protease family protein [uncultured Bradyrhizobium sp.]|uniref:aspartyl protease family protein n=2 Tax=Pseudomonadota TaxID=1224 RepID=UPI0026136AEC|nr:aspartyl protease family protein [uncultured Bradyrhizobium sp.]
MASAISRRLVLAGMGCIASSLSASNIKSLRGKTLSETIWSGYASAPRWTSFELATDDTIIVRAQAGELDVDAVLDSGSAVSVLSSALASRLAINGTDARVRATSGRTVVKIARNVQLALDGQPRSLPMVIISDLSTVSAAFGRPIDLVLGLDMLADRVLALDFAESRLALAPSGSFTGGNGWAVLQLSLGTARELLVSAGVDGRPAAQMILDLGSGNALMMSSAFVDDDHLLENRKVSTVAIGDMEGMHVAKAAMMDSVVLAGLPVAAVPSAVVENWLSTSAVGNIGLPLIAQFDVVIDITASRLWLRKPERSRHNLLLKDRTGLGVATRPSGLTVVHVASGSPAERDGWKAGEQIVAIDGEPVGPGYTRSRLWRWRYRPAGAAVSLTLVDGSVRRIRLAEYY